MATTADRILRKWKKQCMQYGFIRHINGNTRDNMVENLQYVNYEFLFHLEEWSVDWVLDLTPREIEFVHENPVMFQDIARANGSLMPTLA